MTIYTYEDMTQAQADAFSSSDSIVFRDTLFEKIRVTHRFANAESGAITTLFNPNKGLVFDAAAISAATLSGRVTVAQGGLLLLGTDEAERIEVGHTDTAAPLTAIYSFSGNDTIIGGAGGDEIAGRDDDDLIFTGGSQPGQPDRVTGGLGADTIMGGDGVDVLVGIDRESATNSGPLDQDRADGADSMNGFGGNDALVGAGGDDILYGGLGDDVLDGGTGRDKLFGGSNGVSDVADGADSIYGGLDDDFIQGNGGNDLLAGDGGCDDIGGGQGDDLIYGDVIDSSLGPTPGDVDTIRGGLGNDEIYGQLGNDILVGGNNQVQDLTDGNDSIHGGEGDDTLQGNSGNDFLVGDDGNDLVGGGRGDDTVWGANGDDRLLGGLGEDTLSGGSGVDTMSGGGDRDSFWIEDAGVDERLDQVRDFDVSDERLLVAFDVTRLFKTSITFETGAEAMEYATRLFRNGDLEDGEMASLQVGNDTYVMYLDHLGYGGFLYGLQLVGVDSNAITLDNFANGIT